MELIRYVDRRALNNLMADYRVSLSIAHDDANSWHLHLADDEIGRAHFYVAGAVFGLAVATAERGVDRLGVCCVAPCRAVFVDTSTNASRRYCSDRCATRANVAAYRARRKASATL